MPPKKRFDEEVPASADLWQVQLKCEVCQAPAVIAICDYTRLHDTDGKLGYSMIGEPHYFCAEHKRDAIIKDA